MTAMLAFEEDVLTLICGFAPQSGRKVWMKNNLFILG